MSDTAPGELSRESWAYFDGFYDARDGEPLFDDAHPKYRAGWLAFYEFKSTYEQMKQAPS